MRNLGRALLTLNAHGRAVPAGSVLSHKSLHRKLTSMGNQSKGLPAGLQSQDTFHSWWNFYANGQKPLTSVQQQRSRAANRGFTDYLRSEKASKFVKMFTAIEPGKNDYDRIYDEFKGCFHKPNAPVKKKPRQIASLSKPEARGKKNFRSLPDIRSKPTQAQVMSTHQQHKLSRGWRSADDQFTENLSEFADEQPHKRKLVYSQKKSMSADDSPSDEWIESTDRQSKKRKCSKMCLSADRIDNQPLYSKKLTSKSLKMSADKIYEIPKYYKNQGSNSSKMSTAKVDIHPKNELRKTSSSNTSSSSRVLVKEKPTDIMPKYANISRAKAAKNSSSILTDNKVSGSSTMPVSTDPYDNLPDIYNKWIKSYNKTHKRPSKDTSTRRRSKRSSTNENMPTLKHKKLKIYKNARDEKLKSKHSSLDKHQKSKKLKRDSSNISSRTETPLEKAHELPNQMEEIESAAPQTTEAQDNKTDIDDMPMKLEKKRLKVEHWRKKTKRISLQKRAKLKLKKLKSYKRESADKSCTPSQSVSVVIVPEVVIAEVFTDITADDLINDDVKDLLADEQGDSRRPSEAAPIYEKRLSIKNYYTKLESKTYDSTQIRYIKILEAAQREKIVQENLFDIVRHINEKANAMARAKAEALTATDGQNNEIVEPETKSKIRKTKSKSKTDLVKESMNLANIDSDSSISIKHLKKLRKLQRLAVIAARNRSQISLRRRLASVQSGKSLTKHKTQSQQSLTKHKPQQTQRAESEPVLQASESELTYSADTKDKSKTSKHPDISSLHSVPTPTNYPFVSFPHLHGRNLSFVSISTRGSQISGDRLGVDADRYAYAPIDVEAHVINFMKANKMTWDMFKALPHNWPCPYESSIIQRMRSEVKSGKKKRTKAAVRKSKRKKKRISRKAMKMPEAIEPNPTKTVSCDICRGLKQTLPEPPYMMEMRKRMERDELKQFYKSHLMASNQWSSRSSASESTQKPEWKSKPPKQTLTQNLIACYQVLSECEKRLDNKLIQLQCEEL